MLLLFVVIAEGQFTFLVTRPTESLAHSVTGPTEATRDAVVACAE